MSPATSSRWCPTPEQLMILEEMYRSGIRTPNATQIQQITAHLSFYGRIEGKNVFYWFQNHKARDRQKLRKKLNKQMMVQQQQKQQKQFYNQLQPVCCSDQYYLQQYGCSSFPSNHFQVPYQTIQPSKSAVLSCQVGNEEEARREMNWQDSGRKILEVSGEKRMMEASNHNYDWRMMMMMMMKTTTNHYPCCENLMMSTKPTLKTLQLFPVTTSDCKKDTISNP